MPWQVKLVWLYGKVEIWDIRDATLEILFSAGCRALRNSGPAMAIYGEGGKWDEEKPDAIGPGASHISDLEENCWLQLARHGSQEESGVAQVAGTLRRDGEQK